MAWRWGPGPVFAIELRAAARRWQTYALRAGFIGALFGVLYAVWAAGVGDRPSLGIKDLAEVGQAFFFGLVGTQLTLLLLVAPAATAGAVCLDKARGTLLHLLVTDLSAAEIVLGKLAARLLPVLSLLLAGLPVLAAATLLGGIEPWSVFAAFLVSLGVAAVGCALALALSVWGKRTQDVLPGSYCLVLLGLLALPLYEMAQGVLGPARMPGPIPVWLKQTNPFWLAFAPYASPGQSTFADSLRFLGGAITLSLVLALLAVVAVRRVTVRHAAAVARPRRRWRPAALWRYLPRPSLDFNPVLWREWQQRQPSRWLRAIWTVFCLGATALTGASVYEELSSPFHQQSPSIAIGLTVTVGLLLFGVTAATSLAEERTRGTLDVLLTTPLPTRAIVWGKWWAAVRPVAVLAFFPAATLAVLLNFGDRRGDGTLAVFIVALVAACGVMLTSLGLALATWLPRVSRAVGWCAAGYALLLFVPPVATIVLFGPGDSGTFLAMGCPFFGIGVASDLAIFSEYQSPLKEYVRPGAMLWIAIYLAMAAALYAATLATFDRCLGRVRQRGTPPPAPARAATPGGRQLAAGVAAE